MAKKNSDVLSRTDEAIEFFKAIKKQAPNGNEDVMSILDSAEKDFLDKFHQLKRSKSPKKE